MAVILSRLASQAGQLSESSGISAYGTQITRSPYFFMAFSDSVNPNPGASFKVSHPLVILGAFSNNSACKGSRSGLVKASTKHPAGVDATKWAWMKQS